MMPVPFTGVIAVDAGIAILFLIAGVWIIIKRKHWAGWVITLSALYWGYLIYQAMP